MKYLIFLFAIVACNHAGSFLPAEASAKEGPAEASAKEGPATATATATATTPSPDTLIPPQYEIGKLVKVEKTEDAWKRTLSEQEFRVLRKEGTERAFTGDLWKNHEQGIYVCAGCGLPLFSSDTKFESGTGWPSFYKPISEDCIADKTDNSYGMDRTEVECARCGGHQGHVFPDGPPPTGLRYCINSVSLNFVKQ